MTTEVKNEIWTWLPGFKPYFEISNTGKIRSVDRFVELKNYMIKGREIKTKKTTCGGVIADLGLNRRIHRVNVPMRVAMAFIPNPNNFSRVIHLDGNRENNYVHNLKWSPKRKVIK